MNVGVGDVGRDQPASGERDGQVGLRRGLDPWQVVLGGLFSIGFVVFLAQLSLTSREPEPLLAGLGLMVVALVIVAALPRIAELVGPGGIRATFFKQLQQQGAEIQRHGDRLDEQQKRIEDQQKLLNDLILYSMSSSILDHLGGVACLNRYDYRDHEADRREMYFLRDNGLIKPKGPGFADFDRSLDGKNLVDEVVPTPIGYTVVRLRARELRGLLEKDRGNLSEFGRHLIDSWTREGR